MSEEISYGPYRTVVVDPPWPVKRFSRTRARPQEAPSLDYKTMSLEEIATFPVNRWASEDAYCFLWTTGKFLETSFGILKGWGFKHHATLTWCKRNGICPYSPFRMTSEYVLFGHRDGNLLRKFPMGKLGTWFEGETHRHSQKPASFYEMLLPITPEPRIDLFARTVHPGFDGWGDEAPPLKCANCLGTGFVPLAGEKCEVCGGTGQLGRRPDTPGLIVGTPVFDAIAQLVHEDLSHHIDKDLEGQLFMEFLP